MGYRHLVDFHLFSLTKQFPITPSAIQLIGTPSTFCIDKTVPGFFNVIPFLLLDVTIFVVLQLNCLELQNCTDSSNATWIVFGFLKWTFIGLGQIEETGSFITAKQSWTFISRKIDFYRLQLFLWTQHVRNRDRPRFFD